VVAHEPTFWSDRDETKDLLNDPLYKAKTAYMRENGMVIWRIQTDPPCSILGRWRYALGCACSTAGFTPFASSCFFL